jgi:protein-tyrosine-phosphatase
MSAEDHWDKKTGDRKFNRRSILLGSTSLAAASVLGSEAPITIAQAQPAPAQPTGRKPNILMIMGDDIGWFNVSAYNMGIMRYRTSNIDRIAKEGALFTDWYSEQSCTAGRAAFITGQSPVRTGLTKVGLPGAPVGLQAEDMTVAEAPKPLGYATGQFGKNHLGDRNEFLPTVHGFDEFFGNLYHLNAEEEPQNPDYPKDPRFRARFGPRGVLKCKASDRDDPTVDPAWGRVGKQTIENTGPLDTKRMETVDEEFLSAALDFIDRNHKANTPWFCYFNSTRTHVWTHVKPASQGKTGLGIYPDAMVELDGYVGQLLKMLDDLGVGDNTIVVFTSDNGAEVMSWPDGGNTPFRGEKATNWEGGFRVPTVIRWPSTIQPGTVYNEMFLRLLLAQGPNGLSAGELAATLGTPASTTSFHLSALEGAGLISATRRGRQIIYAVRIVALRELLVFLTEACCGGRPELCGDISELLPPTPEESPSMTPAFNVLFVCTRNSARSIMAEAILTKVGGDRFHAYSAGSVLGARPMPDIIDKLQTLGHDVSGLHCKSWSVFTGPDAPRMDFLITLCDTDDSQTCPDFGDKVVTGVWSMPDPAKFTGSKVERAALLNELYASLYRRIAIFINLPLAKLDRMALKARLDEIGLGLVGVLALSRRG